MTSLRSVLVLSLLAAATLTAGACGESGPGKGATGTTGNTTHTSARSGTVEGEGQTHKLALEAQQVLQRLSVAAGEMVHKAPAERASARRLLSYLQARAASVAQRAKSQLSAANPAREAIAAAGEQGAKTATELQRTASGVEASKELRTVQGDLASAANEIGTVSERLANGEARKIANDLEAVATRLSAH